MANGRCRMHGGLTPSGVASPHYKHGRYSKHLPSRLATKYIEAESDPDLLNLQSEIALIDTRLSEILDNLQNGDTRQLWQDLQNAWQSYEQAAIAQDAVKAKIALSDIGKLIRRGIAIYASWVEIYGVIDQRRKTVESERKRLVEMQMMIDVRQANLLMAALLAILKQHITDRQTLAAIAEDIRRLANVDEKPGTITVIKPGG